MRRAAAALAVLLLASAPMGAQGVQPFGEDASTVPRGLLRLRVLPTWIRVTDRWTVTGDDRRLVPFGSELASDSLGVGQLPALATNEQILRDLSGQSGLRLNLGRGVSAASLRSVITPFVLEYGISDRLTVGVTLPLVQTRTRFTYALNGDTAARFNVGVNPALASEAARSANASVATQLETLATALEARIAQCQAPTPPEGCAPVLANLARVQALATRARAAAVQVRTLFGTSAQTPGMPFVPVTGSDAQAAIVATLAALATEAATYGVTAGVSASSLGAAPGPAGASTVAALLTSAGYDSLTATSRVGLGDMEIGAKLLVLDTRAGAATLGRGMRLAVSGLVRLGTGKPALDAPYGEGTGDGQMDVEGAAYLDLLLSRSVALGLAGRYTAQLGETDAWLPLESGELDIFAPSAARVRPGGILSIEATPRYRLSEYLSVDAHYGLLRQGGGDFTPVVPPESSQPAPPPVVTPATTLHRAGIGVSYSTLQAWSRRGARLPVELVLSHVETIASSGGPALKTRRQQIQLRVYYRLIGR